MNMLQSVQQTLRSRANPDKALILQRFFKTGKGEYGEGDVFLGLTVPQVRSIAKQFKDLSLKEIKQLLHSMIHEERLLALIILVNRFKKPEEKIQKEIFDVYLANTKWINNWDLVDSSAEYVVGGYLFQKMRAKIEHPPAPLEGGFVVLTKLARSKLVWDRRIAMMTTFQFIKNGKYEETFRIAKLLLDDEHDLIHKAVGWMLREVGKRISEEVEESFLKEYYKEMPRTMLRYAIERFDEKKRKKYLNGMI
jgi:3-methyladenine DNA glycosylase AlkD